MQYLNSKNLLLFILFIFARDFIQNSLFTIVLMHVPDFFVSASYKLLCPQQTIK